MNATIEVEAFCRDVKLPEGLRFHEWEDSTTVRAVPDVGSNVFIDAQMIAVERISDGALKTMEISHLKGNGNAPIVVQVTELSQAVDKAIAELGA
jgi:hypothetical protein